MRYLLFAICAAFAAAIPSGNLDSTVHSKVVVISDVHGDDLGFLKSLWIGLRSVNASETISFADFRAEFDFFLATQTTQRPPLYAAAASASPPKSAQAATATTAAPADTRRPMMSAGLRGVGSETEPIVYAL